mgnify:CR=1 FL=1
MEILKSNAFLIILFVISLASLIGVIALIISTKKQSERYKKMLEKLGNGKNIENDIMAYVGNWNEFLENERLKRYELESLQR